MPYRLIETLTGPGILFDKASGRLLTTCRYNLLIYVEVFEIVGQPDVDGLRSASGHLFDARGLDALVGEHLILEVENGTRGVDCFVTSVDDSRGEGGAVTCSGDFYERGPRESE